MFVESALVGLTAAEAATHFAGGRLELYSGTTLIATFNFGSPAFGPFSSGQVNLAATMLAPVVASGIVWSGRAFAADNTPLVRLDVRASGGDLRFPDVTFVQGGSAKISTLYIRALPDYIDEDGDAHPVFEMQGAGGVPGAGTYRPVAYIRRDVPSPGDTEVPVGYIDGLSTAFKLMGSDFTGRFHEGVADGTSWLVEFVARPRQDIGEVVAALEQVGDVAMYELFGTSPVGDYKVFRDTWYSDAPLPDRLSAVVLALAYRMEELRTGRPG